jgi:hypothetical protein
MKQNTVALLAQKQKSSWDPKTAIRNFLNKFRIKFDVESDVIDLRTMSQNYSHMHGMIPCEDIHQGLVAVIGPNYTNKVNSLYDPSSDLSFSPKFGYVKWDQLYLYSLFQRDIAPKHVLKLFKDWDHTAVIVPCAIKFTWEDKTYYCIWDGHHTVQTAKLMGYTEFPIWYIDIDGIDSNVITSAGFTNDEDGRIKYGCWLAGRNMIRINATNKRGLDHYDKFMILLDTLDAKAIMMNRIVTTTGCAPKRKAKTAGSWTQINSGEECYDLTLGNGLPSNGVFWQHALEFHRRVWPSAALELEVFRPMSYLYQAFNIGNYVIDAQFDTELENILVTKYGPPESVQKAIKVSYENAVINNLGRGQLLKNDREIITNGLINLYNQNCGRIVAIPQAVYVWSV